MSFDFVYILDWKFGPSSGVGQKIIDQITVWNKNNVKTILVITTQDAYAREWKDISIPLKVFSYKGDYFSRYRARNAAWRYSRNLDPVGVYVRFGVFSPKLIREISKLPVFLELNFKGFDEYSRRSKLLYLYMLIFRKFIFLRAAGACSVTNEIRNEFDLVVEGNVASATFPNSIDLSKNKIAKIRRHDGVNLIFIGSPGNVWHGVDRIVDLANAIPGYGFHCIGPSAPDNTARPKNIFFPGELYGADLRNYIEEMDIGLSSMAMERNDLAEGSPLKTRLYLALGLPVIARYTDTAIPEGSNYFLNLLDPSWPPSDETIDEIKNFVSSWVGIRVKHASLQKIDSNFVEAERVNFIRETLRKDK